MISIVVAHDKSRVIGYKGKMPWHIPSDLQRFHNLTMGQAVLMGRKTFESIGRPLPWRKNYVLSKTKSYNLPNVFVVSSIEEAIEDSIRLNLNLYISGGERIFRDSLSLRLCDFLYITKIHAKYKGDAFFPTFDAHDYKLLFQKTVPASLNAPSYTFKTYCKNTKSYR